MIYIGEVDVHMLAVLSDLVDNYINQLDANNRTPHICVDRRLLSFKTDMN